ncbi:hypothetical protein [Burkholderia ubonensis]|uniref:hypothetical protein n=1 Tax=Burkholderia ubonensis TaxID=101571 RepID=UPI0007C81BF5|nr:hypothetical protein [Burkholderia ubonensis]
MTQAVARDALELHQADCEIPVTWELRVIGKGDKERIVLVRPVCFDALRAHWRDRGQGSDAPGASARRGLAADCAAGDPADAAREQDIRGRRMRAAPAAIRCAARAGWCGT